MHGLICRILTLYVFVATSRKAPTLIYASNGAKNFTADISIAQFHLDDSILMHVYRENYTEIAYVVAHNTVIKDPDFDLRLDKVSKKIHLTIRDVNVDRAGVYTIVHGDDQLSFDIGVYDKPDTPQLVSNNTHLICEPFLTSKPAILTENITIFWILRNSSKLREIRSHSTAIEEGDMNNMYDAARCIVQEWGSPFRSQQSDWFYFERKPTVIASTLETTMVWTFIPSIASEEGLEYTLLAIFIGCPIAFVVFVFCIASILMKMMKNRKMRRKENNIQLAGRPAEGTPGPVTRPPINANDGDEGYEHVYDSIDDLPGNPRPSAPSRSRTVAFNATSSCDVHVEVYANTLASTPATQTIQPRIHIPNIYLHPRRLIHMYINQPDN